MIKRMLLAAVLGGLAMFMWEGLAHELLPLGHAGISGLENEAAVVAAVKANVTQSGFYIFPGGEILKPGLSGAQKEEAMQRLTAAWRTGPAGIMVVRAHGFPVEDAHQLFHQALLDILVTLLAAWLLSQAPGIGGYGARVLFVTLLGLIPVLNAELPLWNWYGFPAAYALAQSTTHLVGFLVAGLVVAKLVRS